MNKKIFPFMARYLYKYIFFYLLVLAAPGTGIRAQTVSIKVKKPVGHVFFFQKGNATDTISKHSGNLFYFLVPDSIKKFISLDVENGRFVNTGNDSLIKLELYNGLKYESLLRKKTKPNNKPGNGDKTQEEKEWELVTLINGTAGIPHGKIIITVKDKRKEKLLFENVFYFKN